PKVTKFPICGEWDDKSTPGTIKASLKHVPNRAIAIIKSLQPYNNGTAYKDTLLWQLNELANIDKNRRIAIWRMGVNVNFPKFPRRFGSFISQLGNGNVVTIPLALKQYMDFDPEASLEIAFGDIKSDLAVSPDRLNQIHQFIGDSVIPRFARFFK